MTGTAQFFHRQVDEVFPRMAAATLSLVGAAALAGWMLHIEPLQTIVPGAAAIRPNMAGGFLLCGAVLVLLWRKRLTSPLRVCAMAMAAIIVIVAALTLGEYLFGWNLPIEQWLIGNAAGRADPSHAGRVASM